MKRGTPEHPKVKRLARLLGISRATAVGILEILWHTTAEYALAGDIGRLSDAEIAEAVFWEGKPKALVDALSEARLIDRHPVHRLVIHDWPDHIDRTAKQRAVDRGIALIQNLAEPVRNLEPGSRPPEPEPEPEPCLAAAAPHADSAAAAAMKKTLEDRGLTSSQADHWIARVHPADLAEILAYFDWRLKHGRELKSPIGSLKKMLEAPEDKWSFSRNEGGRLVRPKESQNGVIKLSSREIADREVTDFLHGKKSPPELVALAAKLGGATHGTLLKAWLKTKGAE